MSDLNDMARDPAFRRRFEKLLLLAAEKGDADLVAERLSWGVDPDCRTSAGKTPLIANVRGHSPDVASVRALLKAGADSSLTDNSGLSALDYARRKLIRLQAKLQRPRRPSPSIDENGQLVLSAHDQAMMDELRREFPGDREVLRIWRQERLRAAKRVFNDLGQVEQIISILEPDDRVLEHGT
jgi:hypothetical protein